MVGAFATGVSLFPNAEEGEAGHSLQEVSSVRRYVRPGRIDAST